MTARRTGTLAAVLVAAGALLVVLLVTWAASIGPSEVLRGTGPTPSTPTVSVTQSAPAAAPGSQKPPPPQPNNKDLLHVVAIVLNIATAVLAVVLLVQLVRWARRARRIHRLRLARRAALGDDEFEVIEPGVAVARELLADADAQRDLLTDGTPRNAVVSCWCRFETSAAAAGLERQPWETSSEFTLRVLDLVEADTVAVSRLGGLYREARFSEHELTEDDRAEALAALDEIHRTIHRPAGAPA